MERKNPKCKPILRAKNFWNAHKTKILVGTTVVASTIATLQQIGIRQHDEFLREKGLYDEYYAMDEFNEED